MRTLTRITILGGLLLAASVATAQPPGGGRGKGDRDGAKRGDDPVARMMSFDKNKDGKLTKDEITDDRLKRLFDRADADKDGSVTKDELTALFAKEAPAADGPGGGRGGFGGPPGGPGGPGFPFPGGPPQPGQVLPGFLQEMLGLTADQKKQLDELQKEVDGKLAKILTDEQKKQLKEMRDRGPGGFGPPGGPGGPGGRGGRGPGGDRRP